MNRLSTRLSWKKSKVVGGSRNTVSYSKKYCTKKQYNNFRYVLSLNFEAIRLTEPSTLSNLQQEYSM